VSAKYDPGHLFYAPCEEHNLENLRKLGYSAGELRDVKCSANQLLSAGYEESELRSAGITCSELKREGFDPVRLRNIGYTAKEQYHNCIDVHWLSSYFRELRRAGYTARELRGVEALNSIQVLRSCGAKELREAGYGLRELVEANILYNVRTLVDAGFSFPELLKFNTPHTLQRVGYTIKDFKDGGCTALQFRYIFYDRALKQAGYSAEEIKTAIPSCTALRIIDGRFSEGDIFRIASCLFYERAIPLLRWCVLTVVILGILGFVVDIFSKRFQPSPTGKAYYDDLRPKPVSRNKRRHQ
jgi:hypothetical protein